MKIALQLLASAVGSVAFFAVLLFWPAGTFEYWQARLHSGPFAETRPAQKLINVGILVSVVAVAVVSALDHRFGWSSVPTAVVIVGDVLVAVGIGMAYLVIVQNNYAAATITVETGQEVVSTGLYGAVR